MRVIKKCLGVMLLFFAVISLDLIMETYEDRWIFVMMAIVFFFSGLLMLDVQNLFKKTPRKLTKAEKKALAKNPNKPKKPKKQVTEQNETEDDWPEF